jgi:predicted RNA binding protein YcfA (HicA-like mRNA interferase family)
MHKLPRDINGNKLCGILKKFDFKVTRQTGSHIRLTSSYTGKEYHITIPGHDPIKIGTLNKIVKNISEYLKISKDDLINELFS